MTVVCQFKEVVKSFNHRAVVDGLSLTIQHGEMVAITGPSGSGKSTVLNMLGLLDNPDRGTVELFGQPAPSLHTRRGELLLRKRIGYLFQSFALIDGETVDYNLRIAQRYAPGSAAEKAKVRADALDLVGLASASKQKVYELSGGEQQRIALARLVVKPCDVILADEPTGSLDAANRDHVLRLLQQLNRRGKTVVLVTHDATVVQACHRVIELQGPAPHTGLSAEITTTSASKTLSRAPAVTATSTPPNVQH